MTAVHEKFREALMYRYYGHPDSPGWQYNPEPEVLPRSSRSTRENWSHWDFG